MKTIIFRIKSLWRFVLKVLRFIDNIINRLWQLILGSIFLFWASQIKIDWNLEEPTWRSWLVAILVIWGMILLTNWIIGLVEKKKGST